jgi:hypothetical protein
MCTRVTCSKCSKPSYVGCGRHVEQVLGDVPRDQRCRCRETAAAQPDEARAGGNSFFRRLFGG